MNDKERDILDQEHPRNLPTPKTDKDIIADLEAKIRRYEGNGPMKLVYALNRKCNEYAELLNAVNLTEIDLAKSTDKTFDRIKVAAKEAQELGKSVKELIQVTGATMKEEFDMSRPFVENFTKDRSAGN